MNTGSLLLLSIYDFFELDSEVRGTTTLRKEML